MSGWEGDWWGYSDIQDGLDQILVNASTGIVSIMWKLVSAFGKPALTPMMTRSVCYKPNWLVHRQYTIFSQILRSLSKVHVLRAF